MDEPYDIDGVGLAFVAAVVVVADPAAELAHAASPLASS